jgi:hypothetical protein
MNIACVHAAEPGKLRLRDMWLSKKDCRQYLPVTLTYLRTVLCIHTVTQLVSEGLGTPAYAD